MLILHFEKCDCDLMQFTRIHCIYLIIIFNNDVVYYIILYPIMLYYNVHELFMTLM